MEGMLSPPPAIQAGAGGVMQLRSYLFQASEELNLALAERSPEAMWQQSFDALQIPQDADQKALGLETANSLRSLIIKTADTALLNSTEFKTSLSSEYLAISDFGRYFENATVTIDGNAYGITQLYQYTAQVENDFSDYKIESENYIKTGLLYYDGAAPVYGVGVGNIATSVTENGQRILDRQNLLATYTADRITFWKNQNAVAYIDGTALHMPAAEITGGSISLGDGTFSVDLLGSMNATAGSIAGWTIDSGALSSPFNQSGSYYYKTNLYASGDLAFSVDRYSSGQVFQSRPISISKEGVLTASGADISGKITATSGTIGGCTIRNGTLQIDSANIGEISASKITTGTLNCASLDGISNFVASYVSSGTFATARIPNLSASIITSGTFSANRISSSNSYLSSLYCSLAYVTTLQGGTGTFTQGVSLTNSGNATLSGGSAYTTTGGGVSSSWYNIIMAGINYANGSSDRNVKNSVEDLDDGYSVLFDALRPRRYKYNDGTSGRYHTGFIAQEVDDALRTAGMEGSDFAALIHLGAPMENGCEWMLRRDEFVALNTREIQKLKARVAALELQATGGK